MSIKKFIAGTLAVSFLGVVGLSTASAGFTASETIQNSVVAVVQVVSDVIAPQASALTSSGGVVTIDSADLTNVSDSIDNLLATVFEVLKLLPYVALIIGGFYLLDRLFGILPKPGSGGK